jgi:hypothetical protein
VAPISESRTRGAVSGPSSTIEAKEPEGDLDAEVYIGEPLDPDYLERLNQESD